MLALSLLAFLVPQETGRKHVLTVEHFDVAAGKAGTKLKADEAKSFAEEVKGLPGVLEASCTETTLTIVQKADQPLRLTELRAAGKKTLTYDGGKPVIVFNTMRVSGKVTLTLKVDKGGDKVVDALKGMGFVDVTAQGDEYTGTLKSSIDPVTLVKKVCARTGADYKIFEILKEIVWWPKGS